MGHWHFFTPEKREGSSRASPFFVRPSTSCNQCMLVSILSTGANILDREAALVGTNSQEGSFVISSKVLLSTKPTIRIHPGSFHSHYTIPRYQNQDNIPAIHKLHLHLLLHARPARDDLHTVARAYVRRGTFLAPATVHTKMCGRLVGWSPRTARKFGQLYKVLAGPSGRRRGTGFADLLFPSNGAVRSNTIVRTCFQIPPPILFFCFSFRKLFLFHRYIIWTLRARS